jgi:hypothetical protein
MPETTIEPTAEWTCARCEVTVSWTAEVECPALPGTWIREGDDLYCLACRRERAGEAGVAGLDVEASADRRRQADSRARVEFEMKRRPETKDSRIANVCHTNVKTVKQARVRLGLQSRRAA